MQFALLSIDCIDEHLLGSFQGTEEKIEKATIYLL